MTNLKLAWYDDHRNIASLASWMADQGRTAHEVAYMVEKPWKFDEEYDTFLLYLEAVNV